MYLDQLGITKKYQNNLGRRSGMSTTREATDLLIQANTISWTNVYAISAAIITGVFILSAVGFAGPEILHNAAHDIRHGLAFPCH
jgi:cobalt transporter subunit CbtB